MSKPHQTCGVPPSSRLTAADDITTHSAAHFVTKLPDRTWRLPLGVLPSHSGRRRLHASRLMLHHCPVGRATHPHRPLWYWIYVIAAASQSHIFLVRYCNRFLAKLSTKRLVTLRNASVLLSASLTSCHILCSSNFKHTKNEIPLDCPCGRYRMPLQLFLALG